MAKFIYTTMAVPRVDYSNDAQLDPEKRWVGVNEAKAVVQRTTTKTNGEVISRKVVAEEIYERPDDCSDAEFKAAVQNHARELLELHKSLVEG